MLSVFSYENTILIVLTFVLLAVKIFAFVSTLMFPTDAYPAAGKGTKLAWAIGLGVGLAVQVVLPGPLNFLNIAFAIGAFVYLADVRPALSSLRRR